MDSMEPTNRELMHFIKDIKSHVEEIKHQTIKTNGRVTTLEKWMWGIVGSISLGAFLIGAKLVDFHL